MLAEETYQPSVSVPTTTPTQPEPRYLRENWKAIIGGAEHSQYKFVKVQSGVGTITNGGTLLRSPLPHIPDGFYLLNEVGELVQARASSPRWMGYPDVDTCCPPFNSLQPSPPVPYETVRGLINFFEAARNSKATTVVMDDRGFYVDARHTYPSQELCFILPFPVLQSGKEERYSPVLLKMAFTEMLRYPHIFIAKEVRPDDRPTPLVLGYDWGRCALVMPTLSDGYRHHGSYYSH